MQTQCFWTFKVFIIKQPYDEILQLLDDGEGENKMV